MLLLCAACLNPALHPASYRNALLHEYVGREGGNQVVQQVRLVLKQLRGLVLHGSLQRLSIGTGHSIPGLGLTPVGKYCIEQLRLLLNRV